MESSGRQLSKNTKYAIVHALLGKKVRYQPVLLGHTVCTTFHFWYFFFGKWKSIFPKSVRFSCLLVVEILFLILYIETTMHTVAVTVFCKLTNKIQLNWTTGVWLLSTIFEAVLALPFLGGVRAIFQQFTSIFRCVKLFKHHHWKNHQKIFDEFII